MTVRRKLLLSFLAGSVLCLALAASVLLYYYAHPGDLKSLVERALSRATNTQVSIAALAYSLEPMRIRATGIVLGPAAEGGGFRVEIPRLEVKLSLEGPFGRRTLVIESLTVEDVSASVSEQVRLPWAAPSPAKRSPVFTWAVNRLLKVFLFREIQIRALEVTGGPLAASLRDQEVKVGELRATLTENRGIEISFNACLLWPADETAVRAPRVVIALDRLPSFAEAQISAVLTAKGGTFESPELTATPVDLTGQLTYDHRRLELSFAGVELTARGRSLKRRVGGKPFPVNLHLTATGSFALADGRLEAPVFQVSVEDVAELSGTVHARLGPKTRIDLKVKEGALLPATMVAFLAQQGGQGHPLFNLEGPVRLRGDLSGLREEGRWRVACDVQGRLSGNRFSYRGAGLELDSIISADLQAKGTLPFPNVSLSFQTDGTSFSGRGLELKGCSARLFLHGRYPVFVLENPNVNIPLATVSIGNRQVRLADIHLRARGGRLDAETRCISLPEVLFDSSLLRNLAISGEVGKGRLNVAVKGKEVNLGGLARALGLLPADWELGGRDSIQIAASVDDGGAIAVHAALEGKEFAFQSRDGRSVGENISVRAELQGGGRFRESDLAAAGALKIDGGEVLHDRFYFDLGRNGLFLSGRARYHPEERLLELSDARVDMAEVLALAATGKLFLGPVVPMVQLSVDIPETRLEPAYHHFVAEPFRTTSPFLADLTVAGTISTHLDITGTGNSLEITGRAGWHDGSLSSGDETLSLTGVDLDLPIWYRSGAGGAGNQPLKGALSIQSVAVSLLPEQPLLLHLDAGPNGLSINARTRLSLPAGAVELGPVSARNIFSDDAIVESSLSVNSVAVAPLLAHIWPRPPEGAMSGRFDPIVIRSGSLTSSGEVEVRAFGGKILVSRVGLSGAEGPVPVLRLDVELDNLDLAMLTGGTSFGKIQGILDGHIKDLEIAGGQPQGFDLLLETAKRGGAAQEISVRAVDNIARLGGAQSPFIGFAKIFASLFEDFPYREIGVHATLKNDTFRVNGTIREGGKEYLVRRGALWGVDVVNQSPDNRIGFKDMVKRIKRITESSGGPVIQ